jgi:hypothetical protein
MRVHPATLTRVRKALMASPRGRYCSDSQATEAAARELVRIGEAEMGRSTQVWGTRNLPTHRYKAIEIFRPGMKERPAPPPSKPEPCWDDMKLAFSFDDGAEDIWARWGPGGTHTDELPEGWSLNETDSSGARHVAVFRVEGFFNPADAYRVVTLLGQFRAEAQA